MFRVIRMVQIKKAKKEQTDCILNLTKDAYTPYKGSFNNQAPEYCYDEVYSLMNDPHSDVWVAEDEGEIIGTAAGTEFGPAAYHLKMLFVSGNRQQEGVGRKMLDCFEQRGRERGFTLLTANYQGWAVWSRQFYERCGYREWSVEAEAGNPLLKAQAGFLKEIGRLNNANKHLIWKLI